jgi:predicted transcriptional regulator
MPRPAPDKPTDVELQILTALWDRGPSTVREVHDALAAERGTGYSTTLKMMQVMLEKGLVLRDDAVRPQKYRAAASRETTQLQLVDSLTQRAFGGSAKRLVLHMLSARRISPADLAEIRRLIEQAEGGGRG